MSYDLMFKNANDLYAAGAFTQAENLYRQILQVNPYNPDVLNMLGLIAHAKGLFEQACDYFYKALQITPNHQPLYFNLAVSLQALHKLTEAKNAYLHLIKLNPNIKEAFNNLGGVYEELQEYDEAEKCYQQALTLDASYVEAAANLAVLQNDVSSLLQLTVEYPQNALAYYYIALVNFNKAAYDVSQKYILKALQYDTSSYEIYLLAAQISLKNKETKQAAEYFRLTLQLNNTCVPALINLATLEQNEDLFKKALDLEPNNADAHANYAALLYSQKRTVEALEEYRKAVIINPNIPEISNNLALILKDMGDYEQALDLLLNAFKLNPLQSDFALNIAETLTLFYQQNSQKALEIAKQWHDFAPDNPFACHILAAFENQQSPRLLQYSEILFDKFANTYDNTMHNIHYAVIDKLKQLKLDFTGKILDLGCGTGLVAEAFKNQHNEFIGVDISQKMLDVAASKNLYSRLIKADIASFMGNNKLKYNFIVALDVFEYIENIEQILSLFYPIPVVFTIENAMINVSDFSLTPTGRYQHNPDYVKQMLQALGYKNIDLYTLPLRQENAKDVMGTMFVCR